MKVMLYLSAAALFALAVAIFVSIRYLTSDPDVGMFLWAFAAFVALASCVALYLGLTYTPTVRRRRKRRD